MSWCQRSFAILECFSSGLSISNISLQARSSDPVVLLGYWATIFWQIELSKDLSKELSKDRTFCKKAVFHLSIYQCIGKMEMLLQQKCLLVTWIVSHNLSQNFTCTKKNYAPVAQHWQTKQELVALFASWQSWPFSYPFFLVYGC